MRIAKGLEPLLKRVALRAVRRRGNSLEPPVDRASIQRIMIYRPERFGDLLATLPVIRELKRLLPQSELHLWTSTQGRELLESEPAVDHVRVITGKSGDRRTAQQTPPFDLVIDLQMRDSTNALLTCDAAAERGILAGWGKDRLRTYYDWAPELHDSNDYAMYRGLGVLRLLGTDVPASGDFIPKFTKEEQTWTGRLLADSVHVIMLNLSAGDPNRRLPGDRWAQLIDFIDANSDSTILLNAIGGDRTQAEHLIRSSGASVRLLPPDMTFRQAACLATRARLFVSPDTSLVHIAAGAGIPTVGLYLPRTDFRMSWVPPFDHVRAIESSSDSLSSISSDEIISTVESLKGAWAPEAVS